MHTRAYLVSLVNALSFLINEKLPSFGIRRAISPVVTTLLIVAVIAVGGAIIYFVVISGGTTTTTYP